MFWKTHSEHAQNQVCCQLGPPSVCMRAGQEYWGHCNQCESPHQMHLEDSKAYACVLFIAFSCAFNSIHLHLLVLKPSLEWTQIIKWFYSSLISRSQASQGYQLALCDQFYDIGVPQGCISFLILVPLYTSECRSKEPNSHKIKLSDDTIILSLLHWEDCPPGYNKGMASFKSWCDSHNIILHTSKTKEMIFDPWASRSHDTDIIYNSGMYSYKSLGVIMNDKTWLSS